MTTPTRTAVADSDQRQDVPSEITLGPQTMAAVMGDPVLMAEMEAARNEGGTAGLIDWLDERGLTWHAGGANAGRAFAEAGGLGAAEWFGDSGPSPEQRAADKRKAARKAQRKARKSSRRR
jgi:hypothetical protein